MLSTSRVRFVLLFLAHKIRTTNMTAMFTAISITRRDLQRSAQGVIVRYWSSLWKSTGICEMSAGIRSVTWSTRCVVCAIVIREIVIRVICSFGTSKWCPGDQRAWQSRKPLSLRTSRKSNDKHRHPWRKPKLGWNSRFIVFGREWLSLCHEIAVVIRITQRPIRVWRI